MGRTVGLTEQQKAFVENYPLDLNATQAAVRAGYSPHTADRQGARLLKNAGVRDALATVLAERSKRTGVNADRVLRELARIAFADIRSVVTWEPDGIHLREAMELAEDDAAAIASVEWKISRTTVTFGEGEDAGTMTREDIIAASVKLNDKLGAINLLMKHLGMNAPIKVDLSDQLRKAAEAEGLDPEEAVLLASRVLQGLG